MAKSSNVDAQDKIRDSNLDLAATPGTDPLTYELRLLGGFELCVDNRAVTSVGGGAPARLLAFMALHRGIRHHRVRLAEVLWPDIDEERGRRRLSNALWSLHQSTERTCGALLLADRQSIGFHPEVHLWVDVEAFEKALTAFEGYRRNGAALAHLGDLQGALGLYRGDLLAGHYDEWADAPRRHLRERYLLAQRIVIELERSDGQYDRALVSARRLVDEAPFSEEAQAELIRLYWLTGRSRDAVEQFERCRRLLDEELGAAPGAALVDLHRRITLEHTPRAGTHGGAEKIDDRIVPMVGRAAERAKLVDLVDSAGAGGGGMALVEGGTGLGKSRLLTEVADAASWRGATVVWAEHDTDRALEPYGGLGSALEAALVGLRREQVRARLDPDALEIVSRLLPGLRSGDDPPARRDAWASSDERWRLQEGVVQTLLALAASTPTVLVVEDVHAADLDTVELLRLAAPRATTGSLAIIVTYRRREAQQRPEVWSLLTEIERRHRVTRLTLGPLSVGDTAELLTARQTMPSVDTIARHVHQATGGNPLFTIETSRSLAKSLDRHGNSAPSTGDLLAMVDLEASASLERIIEVLLDELDAAPSPVGRVVAALAVWAGPAASATIGALIDFDGLELLDALAGAIDAGFLVEVDDMFTLRFGHLAAAARAHSDDLDRVDLHRRAAAIIGTDPSASPAVLAAHHRAGASWTAAAHQEYAAAVRAARLHSYEMAAHYHELALDSLVRADLDPVPRQLFDHERVLDILGRRLERSDLLDRLEATKKLSAEDLVETMQRRACYLADTDQMIDAIRQSSAAIGFSVTQGLDWQPSKVTLARVLISAGHPHLARAHLRDISNQPRSAIGRGQAELGLGSALCDLAEWTAAEEQLGRALDRFRSMGDSRGEVEALAALAVLHSQTGEMDSALQHYEAAIGLARRIGHRYGEAMVLANLAAVHQLTGDVAAALARSDEAIDAFASIGQRRGEAIVRTNAASLWHEVLGDDVRAERDVADARRIFEQLSDDRRQAVCLTVLAGVRRRRRAFSLSRRLLADALRLLDGTGDVWLEVQVLQSLAWTELDAGRLDEAADAIDRAITRSEDSAIDIGLPLRLALRARIAAAAGNLSTALTLARRSCAAEQGDADFGHLAPCWRHEVFVMTGCDDEARDEVTLAHERLQAMLAPFPADRRDRALAVIPEHRRIVDRFSAFHVRVHQMTLPAGDGADPLAGVEVMLTVHQPDDLSITDKRQRRLRRLARILEEARVQGGHARLRDLAEALDASLATIKRDLAELRLESDARDVRPPVDAHLRAPEA